jgi:hypothetical protein
MIFADLSELRALNSVVEITAKISVRLTQQTLTIRCGRRPPTGRSHRGVVRLRDPAAVRCLTLNKPGEKRRKSAPDQHRSASAVR